MLEKCKRAGFDHACSLTQLLYFISMNDNYERSTTSKSVFTLEYCCVSGVWYRFVSCWHCAVPLTLARLFLSESDVRLTSGLTHWCFCLSGGRSGAYLSASPLVGPQGLPTYSKTVSILASPHCCFSSRYSAHQHFCSVSFICGRWKSAQSFIKRNNYSDSVSMWLNV